MRMHPRRGGSDTITINADGSSTVDIEKLFAKKHVQDTLMRIQAKIVSPQNSATSAEQHQNQRKS